MRSKTKTQIEDTLEIFFFFHLFLLSPYLALSLFVLILKDDNFIKLVKQGRRNDKKQLFYIFYVYCFSYETDVADKLIYSLHSPAQNYNTEF